MRHLLRRLRNDERGQALILMAAGLIVVIGFAGFVLDVGMLLHERQDVQKAVDAAALAGVQDLPDNGVDAYDNAESWAYSNEAELDSINISFKCVVGDRDGDGAPDMKDIPAACDPHLDALQFQCGGGICVAACDPDDVLPDKCNTIAVTASKNVEFNFSPVLSLVAEDDSNCFLELCTTGTLRAAACRGSCGGAPSVPLDLALVIDRTYSMSSADLANAKAAALAVLEMLDPDLQHVSLTVLPQSQTANECAPVPQDQMSNPNNGIWTIVPLSDDYQNADGTLNPASELVSRINCLQRPPNGNGAQTNLAEPMKRAKEELLNNGRPDVEDAIIFLTDGAANLPSGNSCQLAYNEAAAAKSAGVEVFTIGFGVAGEGCPDTGGSYARTCVRSFFGFCLSWGPSAPVTELLADMATESLDDWGHCQTDADVDEENADEDHFLCESRGEELAPIFQQAAEALMSGTRLIQLPAW